MRKLLKKEDGYVLVTVLIMFVIFSILGLSLMSYTIGSQQFATANTDFVESKTEAEMKAQEAHARILKGINGINDQLSQGYLRLEDIISRISGVMNDARNSLDEGDTIKTQLIKDGVNGAYLQRVDIEIHVEGYDRKLIRTLTVSTIADVFQYSAVTPGYMMLNGPSYMKGDVQVGGNLYLDDHGYFTSGWQEHWVPSTYAGIDGDLRVVGDYHHKSAGEDFVEFAPIEQNLNKYFSITPRIIDESVNVDKIDVGQYIYDKRSHSLRYGNGLEVRYGNEEIRNYVTYNHGVSYDYYLTCRRGCWYESSDLTVRSNGDMKVNGDLHVTGNLNLNGNLEVKGSIYVHGSANLSGELKVEENGFIYIDDHSTIENLTLKNGSIYVNGSLNIEGDIDTNSAIYTRDGGRIEGIENKSGTLIVLSEGSLTIANNNLYISPKDKNLKTINAFFYTNSDLKMYGVGSNLLIEGGIYGKNITLNAMKGNTKENGVGNSTHFRVHDLWFERGQEKLSMNVSRFIIDYGEEIISNPPDGIPTVDKITVKEIDSHFYDE